ncbi:FAD/NAD(P)-binding protein [Streptomyces sp. NPDC054855]
MDTNRGRDRDIAIVGGGAAAVGLLDALAGSEGGRGTLTVFEPSPRLWRGRPYGPDLDSVLVNAPPAIMSVRDGDFGHYAAWLGRRGAAHVDELLGRPLVPRRLYGEYLEHTAEKAMAALSEQGWRVRVVAARVTGVARSGTRLLIRTHHAHEVGTHHAHEIGTHRAHEQETAHAHEHEATHVALCVGGGTPPDLYGLAGHPGFAADPYPLADTLGQVPAGSGVAVIGSGLTAVDVVVSLAARGHAGPITLLSRGGTLPNVWQRPGDLRPRHVTGERVAELHRTQGSVTLDGLVALLRAELADAGEDFEELMADLLGAGAEEPGPRLRRQIAAVDDPRIGRRVVQQTAHTVGPYAWRLLPESDRARLRRHLRTATGVASPMIPGNAVVLARLLDSGQLTVARGLRAIEPLNHQGGEGARFRIRDDGGERTARFVVNAVNPTPQAIPAAAGHLVRSLVGGGLATFHPSGGLIPADPRVHVVGDLTGGGSFITSSIPGVTAQAARTATALRTP